MEPKTASHATLLANNAQEGALLSVWHATPRPTCSTATTARKYAVAPSITILILLLALPAMSPADLARAPCPQNAPAALRWPCFSWRRLDSVLMNAQSTHTILTCSAGHALNFAMCATQLPPVRNVRPELPSSTIASVYRSAPPGHIRSKRLPMTAAPCAQASA